MPDACERVTAARSVARGAPRARGKRRQAHGRSDRRPNLAPLGQLDRRFGLLDLRHLGKYLVFPFPNDFGTAVWRGYCVTPAGQSSPARRPKELPCSCPPSPGRRAIARPCCGRRPLRRSLLPFRFSPRSRSSGSRHGPRTGPHEPACSERCLARVGPMLGWR